MELESIGFEVDKLVDETQTLASAAASRADASMTSTIATTNRAAVGKAIDIQGIPAMAQVEQTCDGW